MQLLDEGITVYRPAHAISVKGNVYCVLLTSTYDPEDEKWEFLPGTLVRCELKQLTGPGDIKYDRLVPFEAVEFDKLV